MHILIKNLLVFLSVGILLISIVLILESDGRLFLTEETYPTAEVANSIVAGKPISQEGLVAILNASANQLLAERERIKSLGRLAQALGWTLSFMSILQCLLIFYWLRNKKRMGSD